MVAIKLKIENLAPILADIEGAIARLNNAGNALQRDTGLIIQAEVDDIFANAPGASGGTVADGVSWPGLSEAYLATRPDRASGQILRDTGELLQSLQVGGSGNVLTSQGNTVEFGSNLPKALWHQEGTKKMPPRPFLFATEMMAIALGNLYLKYLKL